MKPKKTNLEKHGGTCFGKLLRPTEAAANVVRTVTTDHHTTEAADFGEKDDKEVQDDHARQTIGERLADGGYLRPGHG